MSGGIFDRGLEASLKSRARVREAYSEVKEERDLMSGIQALLGDRYDLNRPVSGVSGFRMLGLGRNSQVPQHRCLRRHHNLCSPCSEEVGLVSC